MFKTCTCCKAEKPIENFGKHNATKDGLHTQCKACVKQKMAGYYAASKEHRAKEAKLKYRTNIDTYRQKRKAQYAATKEASKEKTREWKLLNRSKVAATNAKRRAAKRKATPSWLTEDQLQQIEFFYWLAADLKSVTGESYHVDHVVPLQGTHVCGLHVPWNMQVLPSDVNIEKGNTYNVQ